MGYEIKRRRSQVGKKELVDHIPEIIWKGGANETIAGTQRA